MKNMLIPVLFFLAASMFSSSCGKGGESHKVIGSTAAVGSSSGPIAVADAGQCAEAAETVVPGKVLTSEIKSKIGGPLFAPPLLETKMPAGAALDTVQVDFLSSSDWQEDSQSSNPGWFSRSQASFNSCAPGFSCNGLSLYTRQGSADRIKYYSKILNHSYGSYTWRLYVPPGLSSSERFSIGAFLRSGHDYREIDFEIGYGTSAERAEYNREIDNELGAEDLLLYATNQGFTNRDWVQGYCGSTECTRKDSNKKTVTVVSQSLADADSQKVCTKKKIRAGKWYDLTISFERIDDNHSRVNWYVSSELIQSMVVDFGMCTFQVYCSVENLYFIGDQATTANRYGYFAWIQYVPGNASPDLSAR